MWGFDMNIKIMTWFTIGNIRHFGLNCKCLTLVTIFFQKIIFNFSYELQPSLIKLIIDYTLSLFIYLDIEFVKVCSSLQTTGTTTKSSVSLLPKIKIQVLGLLLCNDFVMGFFSCYSVYSSIKIVLYFYGVIFVFRFK